MPTIVQTELGRITIDQGEITMDYGTPEEQEIRRMAFLMGLSSDPTLRMDYFPSEEDLSNAMGHALASTLGGQVIQESEPPPEPEPDPNEIVYRPIIH